MKAQVYINRHVIASNKKATKESGVLVDLAAISINTYQGVIYCKNVEYTKGCVMKQDAESPRCSGATIWVEAEFDSLIIDGIPASIAMFSN